MTNTATKTDRQIKNEATKAEKVRVFENMNSPQDIYAHCLNGIYVRKVWQSVNKFGWDKWTKSN